MAGWQVQGASGTGHNNRDSVHCVIHCRSYRIQQTNLLIGDNGEVDYVSQSTTGLSKGLMQGSERRIDSHVPWIYYW